MKLKKALSVLLVGIIVLSAFCYPLTSMAAEDYSYKIDKALAEKLEKMDDDDEISVSVWFEDIDYEEINKIVKNELSSIVSENIIDNVLYDINSTKRKDIDKEIESKSLKEKDVISENIQKVIETKRKILSNVQKEYNKKIINSISKNNSLNKVLYSSKYLPNIDILVTKNQIKEIIKKSFVTSLDYLNYSQSDDNEINTEIVETLTRNESYAELNQTKYHETGIDILKNVYHLTGNGVKIGTIESNITDNTYDCFEHACNNNKIHLRFGIPAGNGNHQSLTSAVMIGKINGQFEGVSPSAELFCTRKYQVENDFQLGNISYIKNNIEWLASQGVNLINASTTLGEDSNTLGTYSAMDKWIDAFTNTTNVVVFQSVGNTSQVQNTLNGASAYNSITVGNDYTGIIGNTVHHTTGSYKPDITAFGNGGVIFNNGEDYTSCSGTSCAAPLVTGIAALLCQSYPYLKSNPALLKSILLNGTNYLGTENISGVQSDFNAYSRITGAGVVNGYKSLCCYSSTNYAYGTFNPNTISTTSLYVSNSLKPVHVTVCGIKNNTFNNLSNIVSSSINVAITPCFKVEVTYNNNNTYVYTSKCYTDNKCSVVFTPQYSGYYTVKVTRIDSYNTSPVPAAVVYSSL